MKKEISLLCRKCRTSFNLGELEEVRQGGGSIAKSYGFISIFKCKCGSFAFEIHNKKKES